MATIPTVVDGEITETSWGNAVATEVNTQCVKKTGAQTMAGPLTSTGGVIVTASPPSTSYLTNKGYVDAQLTTEINLRAAQDELRLPIAGGAMTGNFQVGGDGMLTQGVGLTTTGQIRSVESTEDAANVVLNRIAPAGAVAVGQMYVQFRRLELTGGSITIAGSGSVAYNTTSDMRLKERTGDVTDAATRIKKLGRKVFRGRWRDDGRRRAWDLLSAEDVADVAPYLVIGKPDDTLDNGAPDPMQVNFPGLIPLLTKALGEALERADALETALTALTARVTALEAASP